MGHSGCQLPYGGHFFGLNDLRLGLLELFNGELQLGLRSTQLLFYFTALVDLPLQFIIIFVQPLGPLRNDVSQT